MKKSKGKLVIPKRDGRDLRLTEVLPHRHAGPLETTSMRLPKELVDLIDDVRFFTGYSRNEIFYYFLTFALQEWRQTHPAFTPATDAERKTRRANAPTKRGPRTRKK